MSGDSITLILAIWGAGLSTFLGAFELYKWATAGPKLRVRASGPMISTDRSDKGQYLSVRVSNVGSAATTLNAVTYRYFKKKPWRITTKKPGEQAFFNPFKGNPAQLPLKLEVGSEWGYVLPLNADVEKMARNGCLYIEIEDSTTNKATKHARCRLVLTKPKVSEDVPTIGIFFTN